MGISDEKNKNEKASAIGKDNIQENVKSALDCLGREWYQAYTAGNKVMQEKLQTEIFNIVLKNERIICSGKGRIPGNELFSDAVSEFFLRDMRRFDPFCNGENQSFFSFVKARIALRINDCYNQDNGTKWLSAEEDGKKIKLKREKTSIDEIKASLDEEGKGGSDWVKIQNANEMKDPMLYVLQDEQVCELTMLFCRITQFLTGRQNNENRQEYFRLFSTEKITGTIRFSADNSFMRKRERDFLSALKMEFLDYYMADICRSMDKIQMCPMKKHCEVEEDSPDETEIQIPFSNKLYITYFQRKQNRKVGDSAISMQKKSFRDLIRELYEK